jgi:hypothetical protein
LSAAVAVGAIISAALVPRMPAWRRPGPGGSPGLQNRCEQRPCSGGFDSRPPPRTGTRTNRGRGEVRLDAGPGLHQDLLHHRVQQSLELLGSTIGDRLLNPSPNRGQDVPSVPVAGVVSHSASRAAARVSNARTSWSSSVRRFAQVDSDSRPVSEARRYRPTAARRSSSAACVPASSAWRPGCWVCQASAARWGSLLEDGAVIERGQGLGEDRLLELARCGACQPV